MKDTLMCTLCLTMSAIPLFWMTEPRNSVYSLTSPHPLFPLKPWLKTLSLRVIFVFFSGCASFFASEFLGQALDLPFASFSSEDIQSFKFSCHGIFSGIFTAIYFWSVGRLCLTYPEVPVCYLSSSMHCFFVLS